jgi:predicted membrane-bound spermidine synthase
VLRWWFALIILGGFGFGLFAERRPFGDDVLAHPLVVYFIAVGIGLVALRLVLARPVPEFITERMLLLGFIAGLAAFLAGNFIGVHFIASAR